MSATERPGENALLTEAEDQNDFVDENSKLCVPEPKADLIEKFEKCGFCNSKLMFTHELNLSYFQIVESARCPGCGVTPKPKKFSLH